MEKMGFENPYSVYVHCRVCYALMFVGVMDLGRTCPLCDPDSANPPERAYSPKN